MTDTPGSHDMSQGIGPVLWACGDVIHAQHVGRHVSGTWGLGRGQVVSEVIRCDQTHRRIGGC